MHDEHLAGVDEDGELDEDEETPGITCPRCEGEGCDACWWQGYQDLGEGAAICPNCGGGGESGSFVFEEECPACSGAGVVDAARLAKIESGDWLPQYSSISAALQGYGRERLTSAADLNLDMFSPFMGEELHQVIFEDCDVSGQNFTDASTDDATDDDDVEMYEYEIVDGILTIQDEPVHSSTDTNFTDAGLANVSFGGCDFSRAILNDVNLHGASLPGARFVDADLTGANLTGASLKGAILMRVSLKDANLAGTDLTGAVLADVDFFGASLGEVASVADTQFLRPIGVAGSDREWLLANEALLDQPETLPSWATSD